jgi:hypothetical protein
MNYRYLI